MAIEPVSDEHTATMAPQGTSARRASNPLGYVSSKEDRPRINWRDVVLEIWAGSALVLLGILVVLASVEMFARSDLIPGILAAGVGSVILLAGFIAIYAVTLHLRGIQHRAIQNRVAHCFYLCGRLIHKLTSGWMDRL